MSGSMDIARPGVAQRSDARRNDVLHDSARLIAPLGSSARIQAGSIVIVHEPAYSVGVLDRPRTSEMPSRRASSGLRQDSYLQLDERYGETGQPMSLRNKVIWIVVALFLCYGALDFAIQRLVILPSFESLEKDEARKNMERIIETLEREAQVLGSSVNDWAFWDATYAYVAGEDPSYEEANLYASTLTGLNINLLYFYNQDGEVVWGKVFDLATVEEIALPDFDQSRIGPQHPLVAHSSPTSKVEGIMLTTRGPIVVAARPVLDNQRKGPVRGAVVMGRLLDAPALKRLAEQARVDLTVTPIPARDDATTVKASDTITIRQSDDVSTVSATYPGVDGKPALLLEVAVPRNISQRGQQAIQYALGSLALAGFLVLGVLLFTLQVTVFRPLQQLRDHAVRIGESDDLDSRLNLQRVDEIGVLAESFDNMVGQLAETRRRLIDQSFHSGVAELASGVLHNVGNALTPLVTGLSGAASALRRLPSGDFELAQEELARGTASPERTADLEAFVKLAGKQSYKVIANVEGDLVAASERVQHIEQIVADQARLSRSERVMEALDPNALAEESLRVVGDERVGSVDVVLAPSLAGSPRMLGPNATLVQVFTNLMLNAIESIQRLEDPGNGQLTITATEHDGLVSIAFTDNGNGITPEVRAHMFERGFSTKTEGSSGLGLHWCATTLQGIGGALQAESDGPGAGATMTISVPLAPAVAERAEPEAA